MQLDMMLTVRAFAEAGGLTNAAKGEWGAMAKEITDEMLAEFAVTGAPDEVPGMLKAKYDGLLDRVMFYHTDRPGQNEARWRRIIAAFQA